MTSKRPTASARTSHRRASGRPKPRVRRTSASRTTAHRRSAAEAILRARARLEPLGDQLQWQRSAAAVPTPSEPPARPIGPLRVLMVGWEFPPHHTGGLGVHSYELCRELTRMGHKVTFLTPFRGPFTSVEGVTFRWPGSAPDVDTAPPPAYEAGSSSAEGALDAIDGYNEWIASLAIAREHDLIHVHDWFGTVGAARLAQSSGRPLVMTVHSTEYDRSLGHPWAHILEREQRGVDSADRVIAVSRHLAQQLVQRYHVPEGKLRVVYNAVRPSARLAPLEHSWSTVLYVGRLAAMKGVDTFLRAAQRVAPGAPGTLFVVAGEGPEYPRLLTLAAHLGISDRVLFLGHVSEEERDLLLASASVFVLPSVVEPFGIAALEAMAAGVPAVVSKTSGVAEIADSVFAVDFWDIEEFASRIAELLHYPELRSAMGARARWTALKEGWAERALQTVQVYAEVLRSRSEGRA